MFFRGIFGISAVFINFYLFFSELLTKLRSAERHASYLNSVMQQHTSYLPNNDDGFVDFTKSTSHVLNRQPCPTCQVKVICTFQTSRIAKEVSTSMCRSTTCSLKIRYTQGLRYANVLVAIYSFKIMIHARTVLCSCTRFALHDGSRNPKGTRNVCQLKYIRHSSRHKKKNTRLVYDDAVAYFEIGKGWCTDNNCLSLHVADTKRLMQGHCTRGMKR